MSDSAVRGWCPGARRPMRSGDGLILRLRITGGRLSSDRARAIADLAANCGNGEIDLGRRGGLQLRGLRDDSLAATLAELAVLGLVDADAGAEAIRNVVASPLSDRDDTAAGDAFALARALEGALVADEALRVLPAKFGFSVDDGGRFGLAEVPADVRLRLTREVVLISLDGDAGAATVPAGEAVSASLRLARAFLNLAPRLDPPPRRMAALVARLGADAVFAAADLAPVEIPPPSRDAAPLIGAFATHVGVGLPFGRLTADQLRLLADLAAIDLRLTPFRAVLLPGAPAAILPRLAEAGFIIRPADPLRFVAACPGAPACASAAIETRDLARRLAVLNPAAGDVWLHVSGCDKGCASSAAHAVTLVGRDGALDLVLEGRPRDAPRLAGLNPEAVEAVLRSGMLIR
ncbi:precorrin-3B synthase [Pleomorphomonas koreensis]|uniref:precorrin-3B synthase n=1 Tax=Pleomorphomonas koreensis TaxID=257440 RepID=UPI00047B054B|nr:precorrin-3B synthase [Pleomorphomonas koreensis]